MTWHSYSRTLKYVQAPNLAARWGMCSKARKRYAAYLVRRYGYSVHIAVQASYIWGYDQWPYDHKLGHCVREEFKPSHFGLYQRKG